jgi:hypothetical protein
MSVKKKSLVGWTWSDYKLHWSKDRLPGVNNRDVLLSDPIYQTKTGMKPREGVIKVRITIEEVK